jgi:hypothetical protein
MTICYEDTAMHYQKFVPEKHTSELVRSENFVNGHPLNEGGILRNVRNIYYLVHESPDRSFVEMQAAVKIGRAWFIWPQGFQQWVAHQSNRTLTNYAA